MRPITEPSPLPPRGIADAAPVPAPTHPRPRSLLPLRRDDRILLGVGAGISIAVCYPFFGGRLLLLDWVSGPHQALVPPSAWGLAPPSATGIPFQMAIAALDRLFGSAGSWLPVLLFFPLAIMSLGKLTRGSLPARVCAGVVYAVNPFVFDRIYAGQIPLLIAYALLPLAVRSLIRTAEGGRFWASGFWVGTLVACSIQLAWFLGLVGLALCCVHSRQRLRSMIGLLAAGVLGAGMSVYALTGFALAGGLARASLAELSAYRTSGDPRFGLFINVAGLYGFWRPGPTEPKTLVDGWPILLLAILVVVVIGLTAALLSPVHRTTARCIIGVGISGYFLALGSQGPTGFLYRLAFLHVPGFAALREPDKFSMLVALCYACGFAWGVDRLVSTGTETWRKITIGVITVALPCAYTPNLVGGLGGQLRASHYPISWQQVARIVSGDSPVLFLPWHEYQSFPFTDGRVVYTPAAQYFPAPILVSQFAGRGYQAGPTNGEMPFVSALVARGPVVTDAGADLAAIGVRWIILAKVNDWRSYGWLDHQPDLRRVLDTENVELFRNFAPLHVPGRINVLHIVSSLRSALEGSSKNVTGSVLRSVVARTRLTLDTEPSAFSSVSFRKSSPVTYAANPSGTGWFVLPIPYQPGWMLGGKPAVPLATGNLALSASRSGVIWFDKAPVALLGNFVSAIVALLALFATCHHRRQPRRTTRTRRRAADTKGSDA